MSYIFHSDDKGVPMRKPFIVVSNLIAFMLMLALFGAWTPPASGADAPRKADTSERTKNRTEKERQFLYRAVDELNRSQGYVQATEHELEKQIDAADILEPSNREKDLTSFLEWYQGYAEWLDNNTADLEADLSSSYSDEQWAGVKPDRYNVLTDGYERLGSQLDEQVSLLDKLNNKTAERINVLRVALEYILSAAFIEERNRSKNPSQPGTEQRHDERYNRYKNITDLEIAAMQLELKNLDELRKHYAVLIETGRMELSWITRKADDCGALGRLAGVIGRDAPASIEEASKQMIKTYESDISYFKSKNDDISRLRARIIPSGSLRTLDRAEELTENYDQMKSRYEHHITWLSEQTGAYRADLVELRKDK